MKKSSTWERLRMFVTLVPIVLILIFFDFETYPFLNLALMGLSAVGGIEMNRLLKASFGLSVSTPFAFFLGAYPVLLNYGLTVFDMGEWVDEAFIGSFLILTFILSLSLVNNRESSVDKLLSRVLVSGIIFLYPGLIFLFGSRVSLLENTSVYVLLLAFVVFSNDSLAYVFGRLFGKWIPGSLRVSPNKTIVGFLGGILGSVLSIVGGWYAEILPFGLETAIFVGALLGFCVIWGDLLESSFKRRAGIKDSGNLIQGRGGVLDSSDSFFFVAPVFYYALIWLN